MKGRTMTQAEKAQRLHALHVKGDPLVLYNIWDAGSAKAVAAAGAPAVATGSWSVAAAQGYPDGEAIPLDLVTRIAERIVASVAVPVTVDFEGGYAVEPERLTETAAALIATGVAGVNFEDQAVGGEGLHDVAVQAARIGALRAAADAADVPLYVNARTDLFLKEQDRARHTGLVDAAIERAAAYAEAGASGFFVPGLVDAEAIARLAKAVALPLNVMVLPGLPERAALAAAGVARISHGPGPYRRMIERLAEDAAVV